jgi:glycosyltransferase involved in cell wall biosynthesis
MLKILIDATPISTNPSGVGLYVYNLINSLYQLQTTENFSLGIVYQPSFKDWLKGNLKFPEQITKYSPLYCLPLPVKISTLISELNLPILSYFTNKLNNPDIIHGNTYTVFRCKKSIKIMTIYDLTFIKYPEYINNSVLAYKHRVEKALKWTDLIITISESSKQDIIEYLGVNSNQIYVTPLGIRYHQNYLYSQDKSKLNYSINYDFSQPYLLFVSTIEPRKNIISLIQAFNLLKETQKIPHNLVLIGGKGWLYEPIFKEIENSPYRENIYHLNYLSDELVALFYSNADVFVYPSYYEGFGLPVLEAMTLGCPVITANTSSLPEVGGDAVLYIDPFSVEDLADKILKVISDRQLRSDLITKGFQQASLFSWEKTAQSTLTAYKSLL